MKFFLLFLFLNVPTFVIAEILKCPCKIAEVTEGDTVYVFDQSRSSRKIWLAGIDAPQMNQMFGKRSRQNLVDLVAGQYISVEFTKRDRYGRIIGKLLKNGRDINLQQIRDGYAWHYKQKKDEISKKDRSIYSIAEEEAKKNRIGLWSISAVPPWDFRKTN